MSCEILKSEYIGNGWMVVFTAQDEADFRGWVVHWHLNDPGDWDENASEVLGLIGFALTIAGLAYPPAEALGLAIESVKIKWDALKNNDGSYDYFAIQGLKKVLGPLESPVEFAGFVSDDLLKQIKSFGLGSLLDLLQLGMVRDIANHFRYEPKLQQRNSWISPMVNLLLQE